MKVRKIESQLPIIETRLPDISKTSNESKNLIETKYLTFIEHSPGLCWIVDELGVFHYMNKKYKEFFKLSDSDLGKSITDLFPPDIAKEYIKNNEEVFAFSKTIETIEPGVTYSGRKIVFKINKFPLQEANGKKYLGGIAIDITREIAETEKKGRDLVRTLLADQEKVKSEVSYQLHEDVNQLLSASKMMLGMLRGIQESTLVEKSEEYLDIAIHHINKLCQTLVPQSLEHIGLKDAIIQLIRQTFGGSILYSVTTSLKAKDIDLEMEISLFRIIQEYCNALKNVDKCDSIDILISSNEKNIEINIANSGAEGFSNIQFTQIKSLTYFMGGAFNTKTENDAQSLRVILPKIN